MEFAIYYERTTNFMILFKKHQIFDFSIRALKGQVGVSTHITGQVLLQNDPAMRLPPLLNPLSLPPTPPFSHEPGALMGFNFSTAAPPSDDSMMTSPCSSLCSSTENRPLTVVQPKSTSSAVWRPW